jgi:hypothetical protein
VGDISVQNTLAFCTTVKRFIAKVLDIFISRSLGQQALSKTKKGFTKTIYKKTVFFFFDKKFTLLKSTLGRIHNTAFCSQVKNGHNKLECLSLTSHCGFE